METTAVKVSTRNQETHINTDTFLHMIRGELNRHTLLVYFSSLFVIIGYFLLCYFHNSEF
jgi:hypothetical protein